MVKQKTSTILHLPVLLLEASMCKSCRWDNKLLGSNISNISNSFNLLYRYTHCNHKTRDEVFEHLLYYSLCLLRCCTIQRSGPLCMDANLFVRRFHLFLCTKKKV